MSPKPLCSGAAQTADCLLGQNLVTSPGPRALLAEDGKGKGEGPSLPEMEAGGGPPSPPCPVPALL